MVIPVSNTVTSHAAIKNHFPRTGWGKLAKLTAIRNPAPPVILQCKPSFSAIMQLVHEARANLHQPVPMPEQLPQIAILRIRDPDLGKTTFQLQSQQQLCVLTIRFLLEVDESE